MRIIVGLFFLVIGGAQAVAPRALFRFNMVGNRWQYKNPDAVQPSDAYLIVQRVVGAIVAVAGVVILVSALL